MRAPQRAEEAERRRASSLTLLDLRDGVERLVDGLLEDEDDAQEEEND